MIRPTVIDLNSDEFKYYPFIISLNKCTGSCNVLSPEIFVPKETKDVTVKAFNMITNKNESKAVADYTSCDCKCKFNSTVFNSNQILNNKTCQYECKNYGTCQKDYNYNPSTCICENSKYLNSSSVTECGEINSVNLLNVSTKETNVMSTPSINYHNIRVRDCTLFYYQSCYY